MKISHLHVLAGAALAFVMSTATAGDHSSSPILKGGVWSQLQSSHEAFLDGPSGAVAMQPARRMPRDGLGDGPAPQPAPPGGPPRHAPPPTGPQPPSPPPPASPRPRNIPRPGTPAPTPPPEPLPPGLSVDACATHYDGGSYTPVLGQSTATQPSVPRPVKGVATTDSRFGTCVVRATDHRNEPAQTFARVNYSRIQAFNVDDTRFLTMASDGTFHLYDGSTLEHLQELPGLGGGDGEPQWHPTDPDRIRFFARDNRMQLRELDLASGSVSLLVDFSQAGLPWGGLTRVRTRWEGSPSADGRYWCLMAQGSNEAMRGVFTYDLETRTVLGTRSMSKAPDHVSMSPSGRYCVVASGRDDGGVVSWTRDFGSQRFVHAKTEHSDIAIAPNGDDLFVFVDYDANGDLKTVNLDTGVHTNLFRTYVSGTATAYHVSAKAFDVPGWIIFSTYANGGGELWLHRKIMAVELKANPTIINLAHHQTSFNGYWTIPTASVNRDFTRVLFNSNWGSSSSNDVDTYLIQLPHGLVE